MLTLILGGARSGKSDFALKLASSSGRDVLFVATMEPGDDEMRARIDAHRSQRPQEWRTLEEPRAVVHALRRNARAGDVVLLDCITLWASNLLIDATGDTDAAAALTKDDQAELSIKSQIDALVEWALAFDGEVVVVSNEVGLGVVPAYPLGRAFRDALGAANRLIAARADRTYYLVAGLVVDLKRLGAVPLEGFDRLRDP
jgi:adenosylcobinamide kinase / adenosylcobinamide-phosphate guanylyltransferase